MLLQLGLVRDARSATAWRSSRTSWWPWYSTLNPLAPGDRRLPAHGAVRTAPRLDLVAIAAVSSAFVLVVGYLVFKRLETGFADVA